VKIGDVDLDEMISELEAQAELDSVISTASLASKILNRPYVPRRQLPWGKLHGKFDLREGEVTIWAGDNGSGKSLLVGQVMSYLLPQGDSVLIASMEMRPEETVERMVVQCAGNYPAPEWIQDWCDWGEGKLWIYDQLDTVESSRILQLIQVAGKRLNCKHVVIDSLVKCGVQQDGDGALTKQTRFVDKLQHAAKHLGIHIHLIAHTRKPDRDGHRVTKYDVRGASQITDLADNVCLISRNRGKERALALLAAGQLGADEQEILDQPDTYLTVAKQRHYSWEGTIGLNYVASCGQFVRPDHVGPMPWPAADMREPWREAP
jgi:twinkle protein